MKYQLIFNGLYQFERLVKLKFLGPESENPNNRLEFF